MIVDGNKITADDGMILTNGETYSKEVHLGIYDSVENWHEIPDGDDPDLDDSEAMEILLGGEP